MALVVEHLMAELELTAENDAELNMENKPAVEKLKKLPLLIEVLSKKQFLMEFLDHGVLTLLKDWLEPLPYGSLPNINICTIILKILTDFPIDLEQYDRREQLKKSGLGKVIMFLSRSDEETTGNRRLSKDFIDKWSRPILNKSTRFEDMKHTEDDRVPYRRPPGKKRMDKDATLDSRDDDLDEERKSGESSSMQHASRHEASPLDFMMNKKMPQLKAPKKMLQASKLSVEGRGMVKLF
ncbi:hypothetical protein MKW92_041191 [Papaver armeniacum]|nr:hypothetical protein MKW92_041191 [Papaver armeniacum]